MNDLANAHNVGYETGYREGYEAGKKEVLDAFFPKEVIEEIVKTLTENSVEKKND